MKRKSDVLIVDAPHRPSPVIINLDESLAEKNPDVYGHEDEMETINHDGNQVIITTSYAIELMKFTNSFSLFNFI